MMSDTKSVTVQDALKTIMEEPAPKVKRNLVYEELKSQEKVIKTALKNGWSPTQLARRLRNAGVGGSLEKMRAEIQRIGGIEKQKRATKSDRLNDVGFSASAS